MDMAKRNTYKALTRKTVSGTRNCDGKMANEDQVLVDDLLNTAIEYIDHLKELKMYDAINILLGLDLYNRDKQKTMYSEYHSIQRQNFRKEIGRIVTVDFFGHFGTELAYEHPAIILGTEGSSVLVAPISSPAHGDGRNTHVDLESPIVTLKSAILLEKIRYISKSRILKKHGKLSMFTKVGSNPNYGKEKLEEIDDKLARLLIPHKFKRDELSLKTLEADYKKADEDLKTERTKVAHLLKSAQIKEQELQKLILDKDEEIARLREELQAIKV